MVSDRYIPHLVYPRMAGYALTIVMHAMNVIHMTNNVKGDVLNDPEVKQFYQNQSRFLTVWNVYLQIIYAALGLSCDVLSLANEGKHGALLKTLKRIRDPMFSCLVFPFSFVVSSVFWPVFSYDRSLILPPSVDRSLSYTSNHIIHTAILPVVLWEIIFRPRRAPASHVPNLVMSNAYAAAYLIMLVISYIEMGSWIYPILNILNGTIYLYIFFSVPIILVQAFYMLQWYLTDFIWGDFGQAKKVD